MKNVGSTTLTLSMVSTCVIANKLTRAAEAELFNPDRTDKTAPVCLCLNHLTFLCAYFPRGVPGKHSASTPTSFQTPFPIAALY
jgi:hypothetical protein